MIRHIYPKPLGNFWSFWKLFNFCLKWFVLCLKTSKSRQRLTFVYFYKTFSTFAVFVLQYLGGSDTFGAMYVQSLKNLFTLHWSVSRIILEIDVDQSSFLVMRTDAQETFGRFTAADSFYLLWQLLVSNFRIHCLCLLVLFWADTSLPMLEIHRMQRVISVVRSCIDCIQCLSVMCSCGLLGSFRKLHRHQTHDVTKVTRVDAVLPQNHGTVSL